MIIALDGNVYSGKSSLIKSLDVNKLIIAISEHGNFLTKDNVRHDILDNKTAILLQEKYFEAEKKRYFIKNEDKINFVDRSFVSMAAHIFAILIVFNIDIRNWFLSRLKKEIKKKCVIIPDIFCFVKCSHFIIKKRALENLHKNTESVYLSNEYLNAVEQFNSVWISRVGGITIDTSTVLPVESKRILLQQILGCSHKKIDTQEMLVIIESIFKTHQQFK